MRRGCGMMCRYEVCEILRERYSKLMPVIFVSAKCTEEDIVMVSFSLRKSKKR